MTTPMKKALFLDLDNTIYPVSAIHKESAAPLIRLIAGSAMLKPRLDEIEEMMKRKPFQLVAKTFGFPAEVADQCYALLTSMTYDKPMAPFEDYSIVRNLPLDRYLVTAGFRRFQWSKIRSLGIEQDFREIHVVDLTTSNLTKKLVFEDIVRRNGLQVQDLLVVGDDPENEIKAAGELGIDYVLYDRIGMFPRLEDPRRIVDYASIGNFLR